MKITQVEVIPLQRKLNQTFEGGTYRISNRYTLVTRITTDEGLIGETFGGDEDGAQDKIVRCIRDYFAPLLIGEDPQNVERLWAKMWQQRIDLGNRIFKVDEFETGKRGLTLFPVRCVGCKHSAVVRAERLQEHRGGECGGGVAFVGWVPPTV